MIMEVELISKVHMLSLPLYNGDKLTVKFYIGHSAPVGGRTVHASIHLLDGMGLWLAEVFDIMNTPYYFAFEPWMVSLFPTQNLYFNHTGHPAVFRPSIPRELAVQMWNDLRRAGWIKEGGEV